MRRVDFDNKSSWNNKVLDIDTSLFNVILLDRVTKTLMHPDVLSACYLLVHEVYTWYSNTEVLALFWQRPFYYIHYAHATIGSLYTRTVYMLHGCLYSLGAYFCMGVYTWEAVICVWYGCLFSWDAYSLWVSIITIWWYVHGVSYILQSLLWVMLQTCALMFVWEIFFCARHIVLVLP